MQEQVKSLHSMNARTGEKFTFNKCENKSKNKFKIQVYIHWMHEQVKIFNIYWMKEHAKKLGFVECKNM